MTIHESVTNLFISRFFYYLCKYPKVQQQVYNELQTVLNGKEDIGNEDIKRLR